MQLRSKRILANSLMAFGLVPYALAIAYIATSLLRTQASVGDVFNVILLLGLAYVFNLLLGYTALIYSATLTVPGERTWLTRLIRGAVVAGVFPVFAIFPVAAFAILH